MIFKRTSIQLMRMIMLMLSFGFTVVLYYELTRGYSFDAYHEMEEARINSDVSIHRFSAEMKPLGNYNVILERPLFSEERRPNIHISGSLSGSKQNDVNSGNINDYQLTAVIITENKRIAFIKPNEDKLIKVKIGEEIDGWILVKVEPHEVSLSRGSETRVLELQVIKSPNHDVTTVQREKILPDHNLSSNGSIKTITVNEADVPNPVQETLGDNNRN